MKIIYLIYIDPREETFLANKYTWQDGNPHQPFLEKYRTAPQFERERIFSATTNWTVATGMMFRAYDPAATPRKFGIWFRATKCQFNRYVRDHGLIRAPGVMP